MGASAAVAGLCHAAERPIRWAARLQGEISAVIFDLDGLLVDSEPLYMRAWQSAASQFGIELTDDHYYSLLGLPEAGYESAILKLFGEDFPLAAFRDSWRRLWSELILAGELRAKVGARRLLEALDTARVPVALATSSPRDRATVALRSADLDSYLRHIVVAEDVENAKPAPDLFLLAASRLGVSPSRCLVLEDSAPGAEAGLSAGMSVILVPDLCEPPPDCAARVSMVAASLDDALPHVLRALRAV